MSTVARFQIQRRTTLPQNVTCESSLFFIPKTHIWYLLVRRWLQSPTPNQDLKFYRSTSSKFIVVFSCLVMEDCLAGRGWMDHMDFPIFSPPSPTMRLLLVQCMVCCSSEMGKENRSGGRKNVNIHVRAWGEYPESHPSLVSHHLRPKVPGSHSMKAFPWLIAWQLYFWKALHCFVQKWAEQYLLQKFREILELLSKFYFTSRLRKMCARPSNAVGSRLRFGLGEEEEEEEGRHGDPWVMNLRAALR